MEEKNTFNERGFAAMDKGITEEALLGVDIGILRDFKKAKLLIPCKKKSKGMNICHSLYGIQAQNGKMYVPAFTSPAEMEKWPFGRDGAAIFTYDEIKNRVIDDPRGLAGIIINPFGDLLMLQREVIGRIDELTDGVSVERVAHSKSLRLIKPDGELRNVAELVKVFCKTRAEIYKAYLLKASEPEEEEPHWMLIIDFDGERLSLFPEITRLIAPYITPEDRFEIMKADYGLLKCAAAQCEPIYSRFS